VNRHQLLADLIVVLHGLYVAFVVFGVPAILLGAWRGWRFARSFWLRTIHLVCTVIVPVEVLFGVLCPLTDWEIQLREAAGESVEHATFIGRWIHRLIYVDVSPSMLLLSYVLFAAVVIVIFITIPPRRPTFLSRR
jgi:hypothetical protein